MPLFRRFRTRTLLPVVLAFLQGFTAFAGTVKFTRDGLNARTSKHFRGQANVVTTVPKGTEGEVLGRFLLPSGNYGIKVRINRIEDGVTTSLAVNQEIWVYYHELQPSERRVELYDNDGKLVQSAKDEAGNWAVASSTFKVETPEKEKKPEICEEGCNTNITAQKETEPLPRKTEDLQKIVAEVKLEEEKKNESDPKIPVLDPTVEELATFIQMRQKAKHVNGSPENARKYAQLIVDECRRQETPLDFTLITAAVESREGFQLNPGTSSAGAEGIMQLMPATYAYLQYGINGLDYKKFSNTKKKIYEAELKNLSPEKNVELGVRFHKELLTKFKNNYRAAWADYNGYQGARVARGKEPTKPQTIRYLKFAKTYMKTYQQYVAEVQNKKDQLLASTN